MRISDWSSDVCSSDLKSRYRRACAWVPSAGSDAGRSPYSALPRFGVRNSTLNPAALMKAVDPACPEICGTGRNEPSISFSNRSEEHTTELQSLMRNSYAVFCLKNKKQQSSKPNTHPQYLLTSNVRLPLPSPNSP